MGTGIPALATPSPSPYASSMPHGAQPIQVLLKS